MLEKEAAPSQESAPAVVIVQPVEPNPPAKRILPVDVLPILITPAPLASKDMATSVSPPVALRATPFPVAAFTIVNSLTAEATVSSMSCSLPFASAMKPKSAILGAVRVLPERVSVPVRVATSLSLSAVFRLAVVNEPRLVALPDEVTAPVRLALVVTVAAKSIVILFGTSASEIEAQVRFPLAAIVVAKVLAAQSVGLAASAVAVDALPVRPPTKEAAVMVSLPTSIFPNPEVIDPALSTPTVVKEEVTTLEASVVPEISAAALTVRVASGKVIVRSAVGLVTDRKVSKVLAVDPSKTNPDCPKTPAFAPSPTSPDRAWE
jgi:hypothetical protein